jgi:hypothetical protein
LIHGRQFSLEQANALLQEIGWWHELEAGFPGRQPLP